MWEMDITEGSLAAYTSENTRISALCSALRSIGDSDDSMCDRFGTVLKRRISAAAGRLLREVCQTGLSDCLGALLSADYGTDRR